MIFYLILAPLLVRASAAQSLPDAVAAPLPSASVPHDSDSTSTGVVERLPPPEIDDEDRRSFADREGRALSSNCRDNEQVFRIDLTTDNYGFENRWKVLKKTGSGMKELFSGPQNGRNYSPNQSTVGLYCLTPGNYRFVITDKMNDGMCCKFGEGKYVGRLGNKKVFSSVNDRSDWEKRVHSFVVVRPSEPADSRDSDIGLPFDPRLPSGVMTRREQEWLDSHNTRRRKWHKRYGKAYVPLKWSRALMRQSQTWANKLAKDCKLVHDYNHDYGENIALNYGSGSSWAQMRPTDNILTRFVEEEADDDYPANGHLTQVLWRATKYVGCADASLPRRGGGTCHTQVCRYAKPGNCNMSKYKSSSKRREWWLTPMLMDDSICGDDCPPDGCT